MPTIPPSKLAEYARISSDEWYFCEKYVTITDRPTGMVVPFAPWPHLRETYDTYKSGDRIIILKARQVGISWFWAAIALHMALFKPHSYIIFVSIGKEEAASLMKKCREIWERLPEWLRLPIGKDNEEEITFPVMDSRLVSFPSRYRRGESPTLVVMDEMAFHEYDRQNWSALIPSVERSKLICISTAWGKTNLFYDLFVKAINGRNKFKALFFPYDVVPGRGPDFIEKMMEEESLTLFEANTEYPLTIEDAFMNSGDCMFDEDNLNGQEILKPLYDDGEFEMYHQPVSDHIYTVGTDTALGIVGGDFLCSQFIDNNTGDQVAKLRSRKAPEEYAIDLYGALKQFNNPFVIIEEQPQGRLVAKTLIGLGYPEYKLYHRTKNIVCWFTTDKNRPQILAQTERAMRAGGIKVHSTNTVNEMLSFGYNEKIDKFEAMSGHDDEVMSLALAVFAISDLPAPMDFTPKGYKRTRPAVKRTDVSWRHRNIVTTTMICDECEGQRFIETDGIQSVCKNCKGLGVCRI